MFMWNFTTTSLSTAEILLFIKRWSKIAVSNIAKCQLTHAYCLLTPCQRLRNFCINKDKMVWYIISREDRMLINVLHQKKGCGSVQSTMRSGAGCRSESIPLKNSWCERLIENWCDLDHNIICAAVGQWISGVLVCEPTWVLMEGTLSISCNSNRYLSFELIPTAFIVLETCVLSVSSKR